MPKGKTYSPASVGFIFLCTSQFLQQILPCKISYLFRLLIAPIIFFIGVCIPSLSDAFGCNLFDISKTICSLLFCFISNTIKN